MKNPPLSLVPKWKAEAEADVVAALEELLQRAKEGRIQSLVVLGLENGLNITHRFRYRACDIRMIGALHCLCTEIENAYADAGPLPEGAPAA